MSELPQESPGLQRIVVLGAGFAGLWAAIGAARKLDELGIGPDRIAVTLVDRRAFHSIRGRNYEAELGGTCIPLDDIVGPIGVARIEAEVSDIDWAEHRILLAGSGAPLRYDRLVFALGSRLVRPQIPGLAEYAF